ncbi:uncharacterized protein LOC100880997 isoform X1 [Megachile rotundata]|uniref:uncharacterized protein LOC100880997 isoform X1 n=1 Tax=Megachile rotundata TaxID=143995 RepID=UPI003FD49603
MRLFLSILLLFILTSNTTAFGRRKSSKCGVDCVSTSSNRDQNKTSDYYYDCDPKLGIVQKIPYLRSCSTCNAIEIDFSSACIRCGMCLAISDKINQTLIDVQEMLPDGCLNDTEIELLLRTICDHSFQHYSLREINGRRFICDWLPGSTMVSSSGDALWPDKIKDLCHYYLDAVGELELYEKWQQWCKDPDNFPNLSNVLCRSMHGMLHDCRSMEDLNPYEPPYKTYNAKVKFTASYDKCSKRE